jgi:MYXO-CTERM domain-containing protein
VVIGNICPSGGGPATVSVCGLGTLTIPDGGAIAGRCDSFRSGVISATEDFAFGPPGHESDYVLRAGPGTASVADLGDDLSFSVVVGGSNLSSITVTIGTDVVTLPKGTAITVTVLPSGALQLTNDSATSGADPIVVNGRPIAQDQAMTLPASVVGGISETPDVSTLPSATSPPRGRHTLSVAAAALGLAALAMAAGWRRRRA